MLQSSLNKHKKDNKRKEKIIIEDDEPWSKRNINRMMRNKEDKSPVVILSVDK